MSLISECETAFVRLDGGQQASIGSWFNPRTNCVFQQASDGVLPACGIFFQITTSGSSTLAQCATAINAGLNGISGGSAYAYTSANLHTETSADLVAYPGTGAHDA